MKTERKLFATDIAVEVIGADGELRRCPICGNSQFQNDAVIKDLHLQSCSECRLGFLNPQPRAPKESTPLVSKPGRIGAQKYLEMIADYGPLTAGRLLVVGGGAGEFLTEAQNKGFDVTVLDSSGHVAETFRSQLKSDTGRAIAGEIESADLPAASFDVCILSDCLDESRNPAHLLRVVHQLLKPKGLLLVTLPTLDHWFAKMIGKYRTELRERRLFYFNFNTLQNLLFVTNFSRVLVRPDPLSSINSRRLVAIASRQEPAPVRKLSIIMPVFNEARTFQQVIEQLLLKKVDGLSIEIIIVESNSRDGTRDVVLKYQDHPRVKVVLEDKPRGKGHAVRAGFVHATGDFILIQDADLEYDMADYDALLEPLRMGKTAFVLGTRHDNNGLMKMRHFADQPVMGALLNFGHIFFCTLLNILYRQRLNDPFTMYKVFRRDCLFGLRFQCNRFDFDYELVIKLLRKGYSLVEIPVNYRSRSFNEGKKVSLFRDPMSWFRALAKFRVQPLNLVQNVHNANRASSNADIY